MPVSGVFTSWATPAASRPMEAIFSECWSCSSRRTRAVTSSRIRMVPQPLARAHLEGGHRDVDHQAAPVGRGQVQLVDVGDLLVLAEHQAAAQRLQEGRGEDLVEGAAQDLVAPLAVERLHGAVPAHDLALEVEHQDARVHALQDVLVVLGEALQLLAPSPAGPGRGGRSGRRWRPGRPGPAAGRPLRCSAGRGLPCGPRRGSRSARP